MNRRIKILAASLLYNSSILAGAPLNPKDYIEEVKQKNESFLASLSAEEAVKNHAEEPQMLLKPNLFMSSQYGVDGKPQLFSPISYDHTENLAATIGVQQQTPWGTALKASYNMSRTKVVGADEKFLPENQFYDASPTLELSHPLWRNRNGRDASAKIELQGVQAQIVSKGERFKRHMMLVEAEATYWRLALLRGLNQISKENLERAKTLYDWTKNKVRDQLMDESDLLQAESALEIKKIEFQSGQEEERSLSSGFNALRNQSGSQVTEELLSLLDQDVRNLPLPQKAGDRLDLQAAKSAVNAAVLSTALAESPYTPNLDLFATASLYGHDPSLGTAAGRSASTDKTGYAVGVRFSMPLGGSTFSTLQSGLAKDRVTAELQATRKGFEIEQDWENQVRKITDLRTRLGQIEALVNIQEKKLAREKQRQKIGRSTMFQVLTFENDYANAKLQAMHLKGELMISMIRLKSFEGNPP